MAWWLMPQTPDPEVGGSSPTRVKSCCVFEQAHLLPKSTGNTQEAVAPSNMTKLFTGMLRIIQSNNLPGFSANVPENS